MSRWKISIRMLYTLYRAPTPHKAVWILKFEKTHIILRCTYQLEQLERLHSEIPPATPWLPILVIHIRSQVKTRQSQSYKFKKFAKNSNFEILQQTLQATHLLKLLDKMCKYEMDPTRTVGATERTQDAGRMDGWTDVRTHRVKPIYPPTTTLCWGYNHDSSYWCTNYVSIVLWVTSISKDHGANMGPTWVLSAWDGPHVGPMNLAIRVCTPLLCFDLHQQWGHLSTQGSLV